MGKARFRRLTAVTAVGLALVSGSVVVAAGVSATTAPTCATADDPWPAWTQGQPAGINPLTAAGVYMWHDGTGWHIRVTHRTDSLRTFSGQMISSGTFVNVTSAKLEAGDAFAVSPNHHTVSFLFTNYGHVDGLDFMTHCAPSITFAFQSDGVTVPPHKITIGHNGLHPATDPFTISRTSPPPTTTTTTIAPTTTTTTIAATTTTVA
jgi:hypothetical protein